MTTTPPTIHIVDDDTSFRSAVGELLSASGYRISLYESAKQLLEAPIDEGAGCILLDVRMAGLSGPQLQKRLVEMGCRLPIIFLSGYLDVPTTVQTIRAGAEDFLTKPVKKEKLLLVVQRALARYEELKTQDNQISATRTLVAQLKPREREVFDLLVRGAPHKQIAYALGISERTVKLHRHEVVQKLKVRSLAELAVIAERLGLLTPAPGKSDRDGDIAAKSTLASPKSSLSQ
jgi:FixJ family two-component response regulator